MQKKTMHSMAAAAALTLLSLTAVPAGAYSADDVAAKARAAGWPENLISAGYAQWNSGNYSQAQLDAAYNSVTQYNEKTEDYICDRFDIPASMLEEKPADVTTPTVETVTKKDGTTEARIPAADFVKLSVDEKKAYVDSLSDESKAAFMNSLTKEERNSILKQLPADSKAEILQGCIDAAGEMGLNVTVDGISGDNISMTIRDEDGVVLDKAAVGVVIDETGISHTKPLLVALGGLLTAAAGFGGLYYYIRRTEE